MIDKFLIFMIGFLFGTIFCGALLYAYEQRRYPIPSAEEAKAITKLMNRLSLYGGLVIGVFALFIY